jgi:hypothetical protein
LNRTFPGFFNTNFLKFHYNAQIIFWKCLSLNLNLNPRTIELHPIYTKFYFSENSPELARKNEPFLHVRSDAAKGEDKKKTTGAGPAAAAVKQEVKEEARQEARQEASEEALVRRRNQLLQVGPQSKYTGRDETG